MEDKANMMEECTLSPGANPEHNNTLIPNANPTPNLNVKDRALLAEEKLEQMQDEVRKMDVLVLSLEETQRVLHREQEKVKVAEKDRALTIEASLNIVPCVASTNPTK